MRIRKVRPEELEACVDIAYACNSRPHSNCAFCSRSREGITRDFRDILEKQEGLLTGCYEGDTLTGILALTVLSQHREDWADCVGPFFQRSWDQDTATELFTFARSHLTKVKCINFYFDARNRDMERLVQTLAATRNDDEFILVLKREDYRPQKTAARIIPCEKRHLPHLIQLHDTIFPDIYIPGNALADSLGKTRTAFCALENEHVVGYGILKVEHGCMAAEIFGVMEGFRGKGYGWALLNTVVEYGFASHPWNTISLVVDKLNAGARRLYESCGFTVAVENRSYSIHG